MSKKFRSVLGELQFNSAAVFLHVVAELGQVLGELQFNGAGTFFDF